MLRLVEIHTYYGDSHILYGVSLEVQAGQVVALLGRNGMGKTTTVRSIMGLTPPSQGKIYFEGELISGKPPHLIARRGLTLVPQGRRIFPSLSVKENLLVGSKPNGKTGWNLERICQQFPILKERLHISGVKLSGGEQQMLAIARALMTNPRLLLLDEPSEGLAPMIVRQVGEIIRQLKESGLAIFLVEQNLPMALTVADYVYVMSKGSIVYQGKPEELQKNEKIKAQLLGVGE